LGLGGCIGPDGRVVGGVGPDSGDVIWFFPVSYLVTWHRQKHIAICRIEWFTVAAFSAGTVGNDVVSLWREKTFNHLAKCYVPDRSP
jgi:hypothetical protein